MRAVAFEKARAGHFGIDPQYCFSVMTQKVNLLKRVEDRLTRDLSTSAGQLRADAQNSLRFYVFLTIMALAVSVIAAFLITMNINRRLYGIARAARLIGNGETDVELEKDGRDEVGQLSESFKKLVEAQKAKVQVAHEIAQGNLEIDVTPASEKDVLGLAMLQMKESLQAKAELANQISLGNLTVEVDVASEKDVLGQAMLRMKESLQAKAAVADEISRGNLQVDVDVASEKDVLGQAMLRMKESLSAKAHVAEQIARGNLDVEIEVASEKDVLGQSMVTMKRSLELLSQELQSTIEAQKAGDLDARCATEKVTGVYAQLLQGVNDALSAVIDPILEGVDILLEYSRGNLQRTMRKLPGKQIVFTNSLNTIRANLQALVDESLRLARAAEDGQLDVRGDETRFEGSYREIIAGINQTVENLIKPVNEAVSSLEKMAQGDLTSFVKGDYRGDYAVMKEAMNTTLNALNDILGQVAVAAEQVASASQQVSDSSQALSQGATEQASTLEEISAVMTELNTQTRQNADSARQANEVTNTVQNTAHHGNEQMNEMLEAMKEIHEASNNISRIISAIDDIAFQTNLLSLNAAVEAAHAGMHGKGFAVVAEEVRNLAQKSAEAAKETTTLIENSMKKVDRGMDIANKTAQALSEIVQGIARVRDFVDEIASFSAEQAERINQVNDNLRQIDMVTQSNTATAEESAAAAEELSSQAAQLKHKVQKFKLVAKAVTIEAQDTPSVEKRKKKKSRSKKATRKLDDPVAILDDPDFGNF